MSQNHLEKLLMAFHRRKESKWEGVSPLKGQKPSANSIHLRSNDYLRIAQDERLILAEQLSLSQYGHGNLETRVFSYYQDNEFRKFEKRIADFCQFEDAALAPSGFAANSGLILTLCSQDTPVYIDKYAHASFRNGLAAKGIRPIIFNHNDITHLRSLINEHGSGFIIIDSLYSTNGNIAPLREIADIKKQSNSVLIVDETHSIGTHGPHGKGLSFELGISKDIDFITIGLSKAFACRGGIILGKEAYIELLRYRADPLIFSNSCLIHEVMGYNTVLDIFASDQWRRDKLHANHTYLYEAIMNLGYPIQNSKSQIISIIGGNEAKTTKLKNLLESNGIFGSIFFPHATEIDKCFVRFSMHCNLEKNEMDRIVDVLQLVRDENPKHQIFEEHYFNNETESPISQKIA